MDNNKKYHDAMNALAERWCGVSDAFSVEQTDEMLKKWTEQTGNKDLVVARMCEFAYGTANITVRDAALIVDDDLRRGVRAGTAKLINNKADKKPTVADALDILIRHWRDLSDSEKLIVSDVVVGELNDDTGTAA